MDIGRILADLDARLKRVERSPRLSHAALDGTAIVVKDTAGAVRGHIGMQADGTIGLVAENGPAPGAPTAPVATPSIGGLRIAWDGALADGSPLPADFDHVAVHVSTSSGFTPSAATFVGTITRSGDGGMLPVTPLPYLPHYVVLVAVNSSGIGGAPSVETTETPLQVDGPDLTAGSVTAAAIQAGAVTAEKLEAILQLVTRLVAGDPAGARVELNEDGLRVYNSGGTLVIRFDSADGSAVFTGNITSSTINGGTITGSVLQTDTTGERITLNEADANKVLVYNSSGTIIGELSATGLLVKGTNGALLWLDPNNAFPNLRLTSADQATSAIINISGTSALLGMNSGLFTSAGNTDWKWRTLFGASSGTEVWAAERVRDSNTNVRLGGRIFLDAGHATFGYSNSADATQDALLYITPGLAELLQARLSMTPLASASPALQVSAASGYTGDLLRLLVNGNEKFNVDKDGNTAVAGVLDAGNLAYGRVTVNVTTANTPASVTVTGLNVQGSTFQAFATALSSTVGSVVTGVGVTSIGATSATVWANRNTAGSALVAYMVIGD